MPFATRTYHLEPEGAFEVLARANQLEPTGKEIIHLEIGQPDHPTFENVSQAGTQAIRDGKTRYTPPSGIPPIKNAIASQPERYNCWVMTDEFYTRIVYDGLEAPSIASLPGMKSRTIIVDRFSKTYSMTGGRLGFGVMPVELAKRVDLLLTHSIGSTAHFTQFAGLEAITGS